MKRLVLILALAVASLHSACADPLRWEQVNDAIVRQLINSGTDLSPMRDDNGTAVLVRNGYLYVETTQDVPVKIFTILGHQIDERQLSPGLHRVRIEARGIYILKIGLSTIRITL